MIRNLILPVALVAGLGLACAGTAQASPIASGARATSASLGGIHIGGGVGFPIGGPRYGPSGYWTTQTVPVQVQVQVPHTVAVQVRDHVIGTDMYGQPIWSFRTEYQTHYHTEYQTQWVTQQVWVPTYTNYHRPQGWLGVGFRFR
jgi:hypothetical protein